MSNDGGKMPNMTESRERLIYKIKGIIDTEHTMARCFHYIALLVKNGRVRNKFNTFAEKAEIDKEFLIGQLNSLGVDDFVLEDKCEYCKLKPESFSLVGAFNLGLEITGVAIKICQELIELNNNAEDSKLFKRLLKEKKEQRSSLKIERKFNEEREERKFGIGEFCMIEAYCVPEVISKLWK